MRGTWAVARETFAQCVRMKVAVVFIVLLAVVLCAMPFVLKGDGTLAGRIRTFLAYGTSATSVLLSLVTIFLTVGVLSSDIRGKQIYTLATKPLARWQYVLGRWLGVVLLDAMLLAVAGAGIFALAHHLRSGSDTGLPDRRAVETEVFAARRKVSPEPIDVEGEVERRIAALKQRGEYDKVVRDLAKETEGDEKAAAAKLVDSLRAGVLQERQSTWPGGVLRWDFSGIRTRGAETPAGGTVALAGVVPPVTQDGKVVAPGAFFMRVEAKRPFLGQLVPRGVVEINGVAGRVQRLEEDAFEAVLRLDMAGVAKLDALGKGDAVRLLAEPVIQVRYRIVAVEGGKLPERKVYCHWVAARPDGSESHDDQRTDAANMASVFTAPARVVDEQGRTQVLFRNLSPAKVMVSQENLYILFPEAGFTGNFLRSLLLILIRVMFLAAVGVFAGSFLSFAVGCVVCFSVLPFSLARGFLADAVQVPAGPGEGVGIPTRIGGVIFQVMRVLLPDLESTSPTDALVDGMIISWGHVGAAALWALALRGVLLLGVACLIFHKRELARVQV
jgi:hypothetical protein